MATLVKWVLVLCIVGYIAGQFLSHQKFGQAATAPAAATSPPPDAAPAPTAQIQAASLPPVNGTAVLDPDPNGHYEAQVELNGRLVPMMVDTGASFVSLTAEDAKAIGIYPAPAEFTLQMNTANGHSRVAPVKLASVRIGTLSLYDVQAIVMEAGASTTSLLGMTFLKKLNSFEVAQGRLILHQ